MFDEFSNNIIKLMKANELWKETYKIETNKKNGGQSLCFFIVDGTDKIYIAKYFDYMKYLSSEVSEYVKEEYEKIEDFEEKITETTFPFEVDKILEHIYYAKRSFDRYIEVCTNTTNLFPKLYCHNKNIKIGKRFYGLLIEEVIKGIGLNEKILTIDRVKEDISKYGIKFLEEMSLTVKEYTKYGYVHRDISPDNIIMSEMKPIIIDPGFIKIISRESTVFGYMMGKDTYASPEQFYGYAHMADFTSDLYSIGIIVYEIVTGVNLLKRYIGNQSMKPHEEIVKYLDRNIEDEFFEYIDYDNPKNIMLYNIIKKMIQVEKRFRFSNIDEFINSISLLKEEKQ